MKNFKSIIAAGLFMATTVMSAGAVTETEPTGKMISKEISTMIKTHKMTLDKEVIAQVQFTVNSDNEIVILNVEACDESVEKFIKARINYKKLAVKGEPGKNYFLPIKLEKGI
ncbi:MAG: hypothetical protein WBG71_07125 [Leeuwenhoekiella sp.]